MSDEKLSKHNIFIKIFKIKLDLLYFSDFNWRFAKFLVKLFHELSYQATSRLRILILSEFLKVQNLSNYNYNICHKIPFFCLRNNDGSYMAKVKPGKTTHHNFRLINT